jgi:hypothetical protein
MLPGMLRENNISMRPSRHTRSKAFEMSKYTPVTVSSVSKALEAERETAGVVCSAAAKDMKRQNTFCGKSAEFSYDTAEGTHGNY